MESKHMTFTDEVRRSAERFYTAPFPAPCGGTGDLWAMDDRRTWPPRLPAKPRHPVSDAARYGAQGISGVSSSARRPYRQKAVPSDGRGPKGTGSREGASPGIYR